MPTPTMKLFANHMSLEKYDLFAITVAYKVFFPLHLL